MRSDMVTKITAKITKVLMIAIFAGAALGFLVMWLWNTLVPQIFGWHTITFWQALGLLVLSKILFGGFHRHVGGGRSHWRSRMRERWENMTPEERQKFREGMRCGRGPFAAPVSPQG